MSDDVTCHDCGLEYYGPSGHKCLGFNLSDMLERLEELEAAPRLVMLYAIVCAVANDYEPLQAKRVRFYRSEDAAKADLGHIIIGQRHEKGIIVDAYIMPVLAVEHGDIVQTIEHLGEVVEVTPHQIITCASTNNQSVPSQ